MRKNGDNSPAVLLLGRDEPFGIIILAAIGRWVYRHRPALAPFGIALAAS
jgi:hypothetical protein